MQKVNYRMVSENGILGSGPTQESLHMETQTIRRTDFVRPPAGKAAIGEMVETAAAAE